MRKIFTTIIFSFVCIASAYADVKMSKQYSVEVCQEKDNWQALNVYSLPMAENCMGKTKVHDVSVASADVTAETQVRIISHGKKWQNVRIRPLSLHEDFTIVNDSTLQLSVRGQEKLSIENNGEIYTNLHLFVNEPITIGKTKKANTIRFKAGFTKIEGDTLHVKSGQTVIIDNDAWVEGLILVKDCHYVKVLGHGIIRPKGRGYGVSIMNSSNITVDGIITTQVPTGGSHDVTIHNVKCFSHYGWGDGLNVFASSNVLMDNVFARTSDDCTTVYATRMGFVGGAKNITVQNSQLWPEVAHPIFIGLHGAASYKQDIADRHLTPTENPDEVILRNDTIEHLVFRNIDILDQNEPQIDYQGCMAIACGDNNIVRNVTFENIRVEDIRCGQLLSLRIFLNKKYCQAPGKSISDIHFKDITYNGSHADHSILEGFTADRMLTGVSFDNLVINGLHISDTMPEKVKWFKTSDMARFLIGNFAENITFK